MMGRIRAPTVDKIVYQIDLHTAVELGNANDAMTFYYNSVERGDSDWTAMASTDTTGG